MSFVRISPQERSGTRIERDSEYRASIKVRERDVGKRILILIGVLALVAAACSSSDSGSGDSLSGADQELADAITKAMVEDGDSDSLFGQEEAACFATGLVEEMGTARLNELGLDVASIESGTDPSDVDLAETDIDAMVTVTTKCVDFRSMVMEEFVTSGISEVGISCIRDGLTDDMMSSMARGAFDSAAAESAEASDQMFDVVMGCLSPDDLQQLGSS